MNPKLTVEQRDEITAKINDAWENNVKFSKVINSIIINWLNANTKESKDMTLKEIDDKYFPNTDNSPKQESKFCPDCGRGIETFSEMGVEFKMCPVCEWKPECGKWEK